MEIKNYMPMESYLNTVYKKCECCGRVRDLYYRMNIKDAETGRLIVGSFELCDECGGNFGQLIGQKVSTDRVVKEFRFE